MDAGVTLLGINARISWLYEPLLGIMISVTWEKIQSFMFKIINFSFLIDPKYKKTKKYKYLIDQSCGIFTSISASKRWFFY